MGVKERCTLKRSGSPLGLGWLFVFFSQQLKQDVFISETKHGADAAESEAPQTEPGGRPVGSQARGVQRDKQDFGF